MTWLDRVRAKMAPEGGAGGAGGAPPVPPSWEQIRAALPEDIRNSEAIKDFKDTTAFVKSFIETKSFLGNAIRIPGPDAGEPDKKAFRDRLKERVPDLVELPADPTKLAEQESMIFERLGRPKEAKEYPSLKDAKVEIAEGVTVDEEQLRGYAQKLGLTKKQYVELAKEVVTERSKAVAASSEARKALRTELGDAFEERLSAAAVAARKLGASEAMVKALKEGNVPAEQAKLWIGVAKSMGTEGSEFGSREGGGSGRMTPQEAEAQIAEIYRNPLINDKARNGPLVAKLVELHGIAYPEAK